MAQCVVVEIATDQHELVPAWRRPGIVINGEALAGQVEDVATLAFVKPEDALGAKYRFR